jgi:soluble lytic murein transglycosylase-like protein
MAMTSFLGIQSVWFGMTSAALVLLGAALPAGAQVIEINDDGLTSISDGPTRMAITETEPAQPSADIASSDAFDRSAARNCLDPKLLRAVAYTESRGRPDAVSPKGARGVMQLMPRTAAALGVDPGSTESNIAGGAAYLAQQIGRFQSVPLGLAAYNAGPGAVVRWGGIPPYRETRAYVASVVRRWQGSALLPAISASKPANALLIEVSGQ